MKHLIRWQYISKQCTGSLLRGLPLIAVMLITACTTSQPALKTPQEAYGAKPAYDYPINNPFAATIIGLPPQMRVDYSALPLPKERTITLYNDRKIPGGFWYQDGLRYSVLLQSKPAPLVYIIAGTGADNRAADMLTLGDMLFTGGYSVVLLPSTTHPNFIINASENFTPGNPLQDSKDLYNLMKQIDAKLAKETTITGHMLMGYSLGAWNAAYAAKLDDEQHALNFSRVVMINPPLSLYSSMKMIDGYLYRALPNGISGADSFVKGFLKRLSSVSQSSDALDFSNERLLIDAYDKYQPNDATLATIIGLSFRLAAVDMLFTADVMNHDGYVFPKNQDFTIATPLDSYMSVALRRSFKDYMDEMYFPIFHARYPGYTERDFIAQSNLESLSGYIAGSGKFFMITNKDDIILAPGELEKLVRLFGKNAVVFPNGGHLGNLGHPAVAYQILQFMQH